MARFICLVYVDDSLFEGFTREDDLKLDAANRAFDETLRASGHLLDSSAMASTRDAVTIRRLGDALSVTDGPFAETKEHLGGYLILEARDRDEAVALVSSDPIGPFSAFEVREIKDIAEPDWREWADRTFGPK